MFTYLTILRKNNNNNKNNRIAKDINSIVRKKVKTVSQKVFFLFFGRRKNK